MIQVDGANGFKHVIPEGCNFVEILMPPAVMLAYKHAYENHPNAVDMPPIRVVERDSLEHKLAFLNAIGMTVVVNGETQPFNGGVIFIKDRQQQI